MCGTKMSLSDNAFTPLSLPARGDDSLLPHTTICAGGAKAVLHWKPSCPSDKTIQEINVPEGEQYVKTLTGVESVYYELGATCQMYL